MRDKTREEHMLDDAKDALGKLEDLMTSLVGSPQMYAKTAAQFCDRAVSYFAMATKLNPAALPAEVIRDRKKREDELIRHINDAHDECLRDLSTIMSALEHGDAETAKNILRLYLKDCYARLDKAKIASRAG